MSNDTISRKALREYLQETIQKCKKDSEEIENDVLLLVHGLEYAVDIAKEVPAVEAEPKRGRWVVDEHDVAVEYTCSVCGFTYCEADPRIPPEKYCCKCGARNE